jgi:hypothetical protein
MSVILSTRFKLGQTALSTAPTLRHNQVICNQAHNQPHNQALQYAARSSTQRVHCLRIYSVENGADAAVQRKSIAMG